MKFSDVMFSDLSDYELRQLSDSERALWIMRPKDHVPRARTFMYLRSALILTALFLIEGEARFILFVLGCYEFAYFNQVKERLGLQYMLDRERYVERVLELEKSPLAPRP